MNVISQKLESSFNREGVSSRKNNTMKNYKFLIRIVCFHRIFIFVDGEVMQGLGGMGKLPTVNRVCKFPIFYSHWIYIHL